MRTGKKVELLVARNMSIIFLQHNLAPLRAHLINQHTKKALNSQSKAISEFLDMVGGSVSNWGIFKAANLFLDEAKVIHPKSKKITEIAFWLKKIVEKVHKF